MHIKGAFGVEQRQMAKWYGWEGCTFLNTRHQPLLPVVEAQLRIDVVGRIAIAPHPVNRGFFTTAQAPKTRDTYTSGDTPRAEHGQPQVGTQK